MKFIPHCRGQTKKKNNHETIPLLERLPFYRIRLPRKTRPLARSPFLAIPKATSTRPLELSRSRSTPSVNRTLPSVISRSRTMIQPELVLETPTPPLALRAFFSNTDGDSNNAVGYNSLGANETGTSNQAMGFSALSSNLDGAANIAIGDRLPRGNVSGSFNTVIGSLAGQDLTDGGDNIYIGATAGNGAGNESGTNASGIPSSSRPATSLALVVKPPAVAWLFSSMKTASLAP